MKFSPFLFPALLSFAFLAACGDDDSSFAPHDEDSSSSICEDCDDESSSSKKQGDGGSEAAMTSSSKKNSSSSSAKSSSSNANACTVAKLSSSSVAQAKGCNELGQTDCSGTITDKRDNQTYKVIKIGEQWWMAENLNYETENSFCYKDSTEYCDKYGRLYTWAAAIDSAETSCGYGSKCCIGYPARGICPEGWHIPLSDEYEILEKAVNGYSGDKLKSTSGWREETGTSGNGGNYFLFNGLPAGERDPFGKYRKEHLNTDFWTASERNQDTTYCMGLSYNYAGHYMYPASSCDKRKGSSIRCIKDDPKNISDIALSSSSSEPPKSSSSSAKSSSSITPQSSSSETSEPSSSSAQSSSSDTPSSSSSTPVEDLSSSSEYIPYDHQNDLFEDSLLAGAYKTFTDKQNGRSYYYLTINAKNNDEDVSVTVMAENLNIGVDVLGADDQNDDTQIERYCYNDDTTNCDKYGGLYQWAEMMQLPSRCNVDACENLIEEKHRGICPEGWHVLTYDEYIIVMAANEKLESTRATSFGGTNITGYSLIGAGYSRNHKFYNLDKTTYWFYPENGTMPEPSALSSYQSATSVEQGFNSFSKANAYSVRCAMD